MNTVLEPYIDGYIDSVFGNLLSVVPRVRFPFKPLDTYSRLYDWDYEINPRSLPRIDQRTAWTNLITYSEDNENAAWTKTAVTVSANNTTAPDGLVTMDKLLETTANSEHSVSQAATVTAAPHEVSFFIKGGLTRGFVRAAFTDSAATVFSAYFATTGYTVSPSAGVTAKIANLGNGHLYCVLRFTPAAGAGTLKINIASAVGTISYAGSTSNGIYLWGAQVALTQTLGGQVLSPPYISTTSAARSILAPDRDPRDPMAYLLMETDPEPVDSVRSLVTRTFGRIPKPQYVTRSRSIPKPKISGTFPRTINGVYVQQPDPDVDEYTFATQVAVTSDSGPPAFGITGGTFDLTFGPDTESGIAYNVSTSTLAAAINALPLMSDIGTVAVTGGGAAFTILFPTSASITQSTANVSSLTLAGAGSPTATLSATAIASNQFYFQVSLTAPTAFNGGTFTLSIFGETTAPIPWDATREDIEDAINALANVTACGGATVAIPFSGASYTGNPLIQANTQILFQVYISLPTVSADGSSLTPSGTASISSTYLGGWQLTLASGSPGARTIGTGGHGIASGDDIVVTVNGVVVPLTSGQYTLVNTNQLSFTSSAGVAYYGGSISYVGKGDGSRYAADSPIIAIELITTYYLPGVSPGIDETSDIPIPARVTPAQLLGAIFSGSTLVNYDVGEFEDWLETVIDSITLTTLNPQLLISPDA